MDSTRNPYSSLMSLSDLEARLFVEPTAQAANADAYIEMFASVLPTARAANCRPQLPEPPTSSYLSLIESVLLRAV